MEATKTVSGKILTVTLSTRLPIPEYQAIQQRAEETGVKMSVLTARWLTEKLAEVGGEKCKAT